MHSRKGPSIFQNYYDIFKLLRRQEVRPACATWVFVATPFAVLAAASVVAMLIPMWTLQAPLGMAGDFIAVIYLFAVIRFFLAVSGLDSGSGFAGAGSIREMGLSALVEPVLLLVLFMFALLARSTNLGTISQVLALGRASYADPSIWLGMAAFALACFIETGKLPFDLAEAEQELQEGPLGDTGRSLALLNWGLYAKQLLVVSLFLAVFFPFGNAATMGTIPIITGMALFLFKVACCYLVAGLLENSMARLTIYKAPGLPGWRWASPCCPSCSIWLRPEVRCGPYDRSEYRQLPGSRFNSHVAAGRRSRRPPPGSARFYSLQSLVLVLIFLALAVFMQARPLYIWALTALVTKVLLVPYIMIRALKKIGDPGGGTAPGAALLSPAVSLLVAAAFIALAFAIVTPFQMQAVIQLKPALAVSIALFLMGLLTPHPAQRHEADFGVLPDGKRRPPDTGFHGFQRSGNGGDRHPDRRCLRSDHHEPDCSAPVQRGRHPGHGHANVSQRVDALQSFSGSWLLTLDSWLLASDFFHG